MIPTSAASDYSKCPDTWKLTTTDDSVLEKELADAKAFLGSNLAISITSREIQDSGVWKVYSNEKFNSTEWGWLRLLRYPMRNNFKIEVKGCPSALNIYRPDGLGSANVVQSSYSTLYEDMLKSLPQSSSIGDLPYRIKSLNFKQLEDSMNLLKESVQTRVKNLKSGTNSTFRGTFKFNDGGKVRTSALLMLGPVADQVLLSGITGTYELLPERLSCVVLGVDIVSSQTPNSFKWVPANTSCSYQLVAYVYSINTIFMIDTVRIETVTTEITCVKGKIAKKVTGRNPTCPKGYKKK
jgi:hypothetical protein